ncbi:MAG: xanthine dehydrogenase family protein molybdopterin-binding subunit [Deltaproteobacteria bacterium]|nr:xanthine dehydrogenase family protein molybdopterin-binding subunit [Deltaproteobacteria bacterium]
MSNIGRSVQREDVEGKVTGETRYGGDLRGPETLTAAVIRAAHPHAKILAIDLAPARAIEGVVAVLGREDIGGTNRHGLIKRDHPVFCDERVRYLGDALGMVIAETPEAAKRGVEAVRVQYEVLPVVATMRDAIAPDAPALHDFGNVLATQLIRKGDAAKSLAESDVVLTHTFAMQGVDHAFLDLEAGYAEMVEDVVTIHASGQWVHEERRLIALALGLALERVRIVQPATGGAFGGREDLSIQIYLGLAALTLGRPVRMQYTREESMIARHKRHPMEIEYTLGAKKDGTFTAAKVIIRSDEGAYASTGPAVLRKAVSHCTGPYRVPNVEADGVALFTNNCPTGAMRGFGACQLAIAYEGMVLAMARALGMDVVALKRKNLLRDGECLTTGQVVPVASAIDCLDAALARFGWADRAREAPSPTVRRGYGVSTFCFGVGYGDGYPDASRARVRFADDNVLEVYSGGVEVGQGLHSLLAQIAGEEFGIESSAVRVIASDTARTPESGSSSATRQTVFSGNAVKLAAGELHRQVMDAAAVMLGLHWEDLVIKGDRVVGVHHESVAAPLAWVLASARERGFLLDATAVYKPRTVAPVDDSGQSPRAFLTYMFGAHIAEVWVDIETGEARVKRIVAAHDVGKAINPREVAGQIEGGVAQGLGMALMEEVVTRNGRILNASFTDYIIPTILDVPTIDAVIVERVDLEGPYGARGVGEPPLIGAVPAVLAAISDAIGRPVHQTPATAERVWTIMQSPEPTLVTTWSLS